MSDDPVDEVAQGSNVRSSRSEAAHTDAAHTDADSPGGDSLPPSVIDEAERLRRLERNATDEGEAMAYADRRATLLARYDFTDRVRSDDGEEVLVLHPTAWHDPNEEVIRTDRIEDLSRAVEILLDGPGDPENWDALEAENRALARSVADEHGGVHGATAEALADFMSNHYAKPITSASRAELEEFRTEYFVRNAWPTEEQKRLLEDSLERVFETAGETVPGRRPPSR